MRSKRFNVFMRLVLIFAVSSNVLFCLGGLYYISNCNGIVTRDRIDLTRTEENNDRRGAWNTIYYRKDEIIPPWAKLNNNSAQYWHEDAREHEKPVCPELPPNLGNVLVDLYFVTLTM